MEGGCRQVALATGGEKWGEMRGLREVRGLEHDIQLVGDFCLGFGWWAFLVFVLSVMICLSLQGRQ